MLCIHRNIVAIFNLRIQKAGGPSEHVYYVQNISFFSTLELQYY
jgi:hypothetical protein